MFTILWFLRLSDAIKNIRFFASIHFYLSVGGFSFGYVHVFGSRIFIGVHTTLNYIIAEDVFQLCCVGGRV